VEDQEDWLSGFGTGFLGHELLMLLEEFCIRVRMTVRRRDWETYPRSRLAKPQRREKRITHRMKLNITGLVNTVDLNAGQYGCERLCSVSSNSPFPKPAAMEKYGLIGLRVL
jgi:hypothetical protein